MLNSRIIYILIKHEDLISKESGRVKISQHALYVNKNYIFVMQDH